MENRRRSAIEIARQEARNAREKRGGQNLVRVSMFAPEVDGRKRMEKNRRKNRIGRIILGNRARSVYKKNCSM